MPTRHTETVVVSGKRLGRRPHDPDRPVLRLSSILTGLTPTHPATVDHFGLVPAKSWGDLGNFHYGDCGPADVVHDRMLISEYLGGVASTLGTADALDLYKRSGNPNFPADDNGVVMADMLSEVHKTGVGPPDARGNRTRCVAYAQVNVADLDEVRAAIAIFGSLSTGADLHRSSKPRLMPAVPGIMTAALPTGAATRSLLANIRAIPRRAGPTSGQLPGVLRSASRINSGHSRCKRPGL